MKRNCLLLFVLLVASLCFSQTKDETENWIKSFISVYSNGTINFENGILIHDDPYDPTGLHVKGSVAIKDLAGVKVSGGTKGHTAIYLSCFNGNCVNSGLKLKSQTSFKFYQSNKLMIQLNSEISYELQERIEKAFNHLIKLYGGKVLSDTF